MKSLKSLFISALMLFFITAPGFALQVGDSAPDFQAISTAGVINLSQALQQGPVVLAFYYADFTPV